MRSLRKTRKRRRRRKKRMKMRTNPLKKKLKFQTMMTNLALLQEESPRSQVICRS